MIQHSWDTLKTFSRNDKQLQGIPGAIAVLHTHSRCLGFHPHVHACLCVARRQVVIPAGAIDRDKRLWRTKTYQNSETKQTEYKTVTGEAFLWLIFRHILPKGFRRARNFGFLHPNSKQLIQILQLICKLDPNRALAWIKKRPPRRA